MTTDNKSACISANSNTNTSTFYHNNWYLQYPNGPYWIVPDYQHQYNPPISTPEPLKIWNTGTTLSSYVPPITQPEVNIMVNNNRVRNYTTSGNTIVYLNEGEFAIEIFNKNQVTIGAKFKINGKYISTSHLIIYPGQRIVLDRYIDTKDKFKFTVYSVDKNNADVEKIIKNNGDLEIEFYQEYQQPIYVNTYVVPSTLYYCANVGSTTLSGSTFTTANSAASTLTSTTVNTLSRNLNDDVKETGFVEKGNSSNQDLTYVNKTFEYFYSFVTKIKLLPMSEKPIETKDLVVHCTSCGHKAKRHHKFCSNCGTKIE